MGGGMGGGVEGGVGGGVGEVVRLRAARVAVPAVVAARDGVGQLRAPNNGPPPACALNDCLQCDEDEAGPVFKAVAGRTRRRSGLESAIARPCSTVAQIVHEVCPSG